MLNALEKLKVSSYDGSRMSGATKAEATAEMNKLTEQDALVTEANGFTTGWDNEATFNAAIAGIDNDIRQTPGYDAKQDRLLPNTTSRKYI